MPISIYYHTFPSKLPACCFTSKEDGVFISPCQSPFTPILFMSILQQTFFDVQIYYIYFNLSDNYL